VCSQSLCTAATSLDLLTSGLLCALCAQKRYELCILPCLKQHSQAVHTDAEKSTLMQQGFMCQYFDACTVFLSCADMPCKKCRPIMPRPSKPGIVWQV
jgi:hypothetical protein